VSGRKVSVYVVSVIGEFHVSARNKGLWESTVEGSLRTSFLQYSILADNEVLKMRNPLLTIMRCYLASRNKCNV